MSGDERRRDVLAAAVTEFAEKGLHGTGVQAIADRVGVSQPYLFQLFGTKKQLFLAALRRGFGQVSDAFRKAAAGASTPEEALEAMGDAYLALLADRTLLLMQLQGYAASHDEQVREVMRDEFESLFRLVGELSGADSGRLHLFFATGMLLNVQAALDLGSGSAESAEWMKSCLAARLG